MTGVRTRTLVNVQKSGRAVYTNELKVVVRDGKTADDGAWLDAGAEVELAMNVPDAKGGGAQKRVPPAAAVAGRPPYRMPNVASAIHNLTT